MSGAWRRCNWGRVAVALTGLAALAAYLVPRLLAARAQWPMWDVAVYWWGGRQALRDTALYAPHAPRSFTYPPFAAAVFGLASSGPEIVLKIAVVATSLLGLLALAWLSVRAAGLGRRPELAVAAGALALLTQPVAYTLRLGEVNLILAGLIAADLLRRRDGAWGQGIATGLAAGIKLTPLIFVGYLLVTRRFRAAAAAVLAFAGTIVAGSVLLPSQSRSFWLGGVFANQHRIGNNYNPANQSLAGMMARLGGGLPAVHTGWIAATAVVGAGGLTVAALLHRRGQPLAGLACCGLTGLLVSPMSWTHHWVWVIPLLVATAAAAWHRRSWWWGLATVTLFVLFSGVDPMPWPGRQPGVLRLLEGNLYVLCGLAVLAGSALLLIRAQRMSVYRLAYYALRSIVVRNSQAPQAGRHSVGEGLDKWSDPPLLVLASLAGGPKHGYAITQDVAAQAGVQLGPGTLYGAIRRLEDRGLIEALPAQERRRPYRLTAAGERVLTETATRMRQVAELGLSRLAAAQETA